MRKLSDLISDIKRERNSIPMQNAAALTVMGFEVQQQVKEMIGTKQIFWKDLAPDTIERKRRSGGGKNGDPASVLWDDGTFHDSIEYTLVGKKKVQIFSEADSAIYTEYGTAHMPPRPVFKPAALIVLKRFLQGNRLQKFYLHSLR